MIEQHTPPPQPRFYTQAHRGYVSIVDRSTLSVVDTVTWSGRGQHAAMQEARERCQGLNAPRWEQRAPGVFEGVYGTGEEVRP